MWVSGWKRLEKGKKRKRRNNYLRRRGELLVAERVGSGRSAGEKDGEVDEAEEAAEIGPGPATDALPNA